MILSNHQNHSILRLKDTIISGCKICAARVIVYVKRSALHSVFCAESPAVTSDAGP